MYNIFANICRVKIKIFKISEKRIYAETWLYCLGSLNLKFLPSSEKLIFGGKNINVKLPYGSRSKEGNCNTTYEFVFHFPGVSHWRPARSFVVNSVPKLMHWQKMHHLCVKSEEFSEADHPHRCFLLSDGPFWQPRFYFPLRDFTSI